MHSVKNRRFSNAKTRSSHKVNKYQANVISKNIDVKYVSFKINFDSTSNDLYYLCSFLLLLVNIIAILIYRLNGRISYLLVYF